MSTPGHGEKRAVKSIGRGTTIMVVGSLLLVLFNFLGRVIVARYVSLPEWGAYNLGLAFTGILSTVALLGLPSAIARTLAYESDPAVQQRTIRVATVLAVVSSVTASITVYIFSAPLANLFQAGSSGPLAETFQLFSVTVGFILLSTFLAAIFQGFENAFPQAWFNNIVNPAMFLVFLGLFLWLHPGFFGILLSYVLASVVSFVGVAVYTWRKFPVPPHPKPTAPVKIPSELWSLTLGLWAVTSLYLITAWLDTLILGLYRNSTDVGYYSAAISLGRVLTVGNAALLFVYLPVASRLVRSKDVPALRSTYALSTRWTVAIAFPFFLLFTFLPGLSLAAVFGPRYAAAAFPLQILTLGAFVSTFTGPAASALAAQARSRELLIISGASALLSAIICFSLVPSMGSVGASIAWTASRVAYVWLGLGLLFWSDRVHPFGREFLLPLAVALAVGGPLFLLFSQWTLAYWTVVPLFFLGEAIFIGAILLTRSLSEGDLQALRGIERVLGFRMESIERFLRRFITVTVPPAPTVTP
jgi:O-antigen/teichoic acid export membrane protein